MRKFFLQRIKTNDFVIKCTFLVVFFCVLSCFLNNKDTITKFAVQKMNRISSGWILDGEKEIDLPYHVKGQQEKTMVLETTIPDNIKNNMVIAMQSNYCINEFYVDGELRNEYGGDNQHSYGEMVGNVYVMTTVNEEDIGKTLRIEITPHYSQGMEIPLVYYGFMNNVLLNVMHKNIWKLCVCVVYVLFIIISLELCIKQRKNKGIHVKVGMYQSYAILAFFAMTWIICSSDIPQFFTSHNEAVSFLSYLSLSVVGVPYCIFCSDIFDKRKKQFLGIAYLGCLNTIVIILLYLLDIADPPQTLIITHLYLGLVLISSIILTVKEKQANYKIRKMKQGIVCLICFVIAALLLYYVAPTSGSDSIALGIGFTIFSAQLLSINVAESDKVIQELVRVEAYKELAYKDQLTQLGNRAAFDQMKDALIQNPDMKKEVVLFMYDLNDLKKNNDQYGHQVGDQTIIGTAKCIQNAFGNMGESFRIGGDEFATVIIEKNLDPNELLQLFEKSVEEYNQTAEIKISVAKGYAKAMVKDITEESSRAYFYEADQNMYENKKEMKR